MWMVLDSENGIVGFYSNREEAKEVYKDHKIMIQAKDGIEEDDQVILARVEQYFFADEADDDPSFFELKEKVY